MDVKDLWNLNTKQLEQLGSDIDVIVDNYDITLDNSEFENKLISAINRGDSLKGYSNNFGTKNDYNVGLEQLKNNHTSTQIELERKRKIQKAFTLSKVKYTDDNLEDYQYAVLLKIDNADYSVLLKATEYNRIRNFPFYYTGKAKYKKLNIVAVMYICGAFSKRYSIDVHFYPGNLKLMKVIRITKYEPKVRKRSHKVELVEIIRI